jgi:heme/copper-type cytochrome/quinol oxidase subunit 3
MAAITTSPRSNIRTNIEGSKTQERLTHSQVGMFVTMASFAMLFGTLLLSYLLIRSRQPTWPPIGIEPLNPLLPAISTIVLLLSSGLFHLACNKLKAAEISQARLTWAAGTLLGAVFMVLQLVICWQWRREGITAGESLFASILYTLIGVHLFHALASWGTLVWIAFRKASWTATSEAPLMATWFWHFLDAIWIITFLLIFVG